MTGTPIQNNLMEFWALIDWCTASTILGSMNSFLTKYNNKIIAGQDPKATEEQRKAG